MAELESALVDPPYERSVFANRTLNMRSIRAIGYDMDYTLIHYDVKQWEQTAYEHLRGRLLELGFPEHRRCRSNPLYPVRRDQTPT